MHSGEGILTYEKNIQRVLDNYIEKMEAKYGKKGSGIIGDIYNRIKDVLKGVRKRASPSIRKFLEQNGNAKITKIIIGRQPITPFIEKAASWLSFGLWDKNKKKLAYDKMLHLFMIITLDNGKTFKLEKNHLPEISHATDPGKDSMEIKAPNVTLNEFFVNGEKQAGGDKLWVYDAITQNCQYFVKWMLEGSNAYSPEINKFVMQDAAKVIENLSWFGKLARGLTDAANVVDVIKHGGKMAPKFYKFETYAYKHKDDPDYKEIIKEEREKWNEYKRKLSEQEFHNWLMCIRDEGIISTNCDYNDIYDRYHGKYKGGRMAPIYYKMETYLTKDKTLPNYKEIRKAEIKRWKEYKKNLTEEEFHYWLQCLKDYSILDGKCEMYLGGIIYDDESNSKKFRTFPINKRMA
jgi:hypothetical protein